MYLYIDTLIRIFYEYEICTLIHNYSINIILFIRHLSLFCYIWNVKEANKTHPLQKILQLCVKRNIGRMPPPFLASAYSHLFCPWNYMPEKICLIFYKGENIPQKSWHPSENRTIVFSVSEKHTVEISSSHLQKSGMLVRLPPRKKRISDHSSGRKYKIPHFCRRDLEISKVGSLTHRIWWWNFR